MAGGVDWTLLGLGAAGSVPGALVGARLTGRLSRATTPACRRGDLLVAGTAAIVQGAV